MKNEEYEYGGWLVGGFVMLVVLFIVVPALCGVCWWIGDSIGSDVPGAIATVVGVAGILICLAGFFTQEPNESRVMIFFGQYKGTCRQVGFYWANPFMTRRKLSLRIRNMDIEPIKVNDKVGNPVLIGMVLVWRIKDTYRAVFDLDSASLGVNGGNYNAAFQNFVRIQSDAALREVTGHYAYDQTDNQTTELTLRDGGDEINELLEQKINDRLAMAGMEVVEARINYLAYAPEIAAVMLRRQQAAAIISAREKIVEGAVSMVDMALRRLEEDKVVTLDDERKAAMVSNLLVVLCADEPAQPIVNTGNQ
ncbi:MAG: SPFH domain-containing protein [Bacteroides sp.]|nr:SPFH domain-containing protein [Bacteroides sp.]MCM1413743.1 SPFH domain-containing protein [Bacteroides sp.]MCM1472238.1 SPFH domain-containing protein [Bacteroides sp.]